MKAPSPCADVAILGGGLAGLTLARQLVRLETPMRIVILEKRDFPVPEAAFKVGESSVEIGAHYFGKVLGLEDHIREHHLPKLGLRFFFTPKEAEKLADGFEVGIRKVYPTPSFQLDRGLLENHLAAELQQAGVVIETQARVRGVDLGEHGAPHAVRWQRGAQIHDLSVRWVVDTSGRAGLLKRQLGLLETINHHVNAVWFRLNKRLRVDDWGLPPLHDGTEEPVSRWLSTNHLMGEGYWVWLIPLPGGATSVGIVADPRFHPLARLNRFERALAWLEQHQPICGAAVRRGADQLMDFKVLRHFTHGCKQVFSEQRWALSGDAGLFLDPFYSPGSDFIAFSNTFITALIQRDLWRRPIGAMAAIFDALYREFFQNSLRVYQGQYGMFGNPGVMSFKLIWDYAVYWSFFGPLFMQGFLTNVSLYDRLRDMAAEIGDLNARMQAFFRQWHAVWQPPAEAGFFEQDLDYLKHLNASLMDPATEAEFVARFEKMYSDLCDLSVEMIGYGARFQQQLGEFLPPDGVHRSSNILDPVWAHFQARAHSSFLDKQTQPRG